MITSSRIVLVFLFISLASLAVIPNLGIDLIPKEIVPQFTISYHLPGSHPKLVEQQVTAPLENVLSEINQIKKIESYSKYNEGQIHITFDKGADIQAKKLELNSTIRQLYPQLPSNLSYPRISQESNKEKSQDSPLLIFTITGPATGYEIRSQSEKVFFDRLSRIKGLRDISFLGNENLQMNVIFDQDLMDIYGINVHDIYEKILLQNETKNLGSVVSGDKEYFVKIQGIEYSITSVQNLLIKDKVHLKDIANIYCDEQEPKRHFRINGKNAITLIVYKREDENAILLSNAVKETIRERSSLLPAGYEVRVEYDDSEFVQREMSNVFTRIFSSLLILISFIFVFYRNWKFAFALIMSLAVTISVTILFAWMFQITIHIYTLAGIAISFGLLVDNSIVMLDHYHHFKTRRIFLALLAATATTVAALLLVFLLPEDERKNLVDFSFIIVLSLTISLICSLVFTPGFYDLLTKKKRKKLSLSFRAKLRHKSKMLRVYQNVIASIAKYRKIFTIVLILTFGIPCFLLPVHWDNHAWYNQTIGSELYQKEIRPYSDKLLGGMLYYFVRNTFVKSNYRDPSQTKLFVSAELPYGNTLEQMNFVITEIENYLATVKGISKYITNVYSGQSAQIEITFQEAYEQSKLPINLKLKLVERSSDWSGIKWNIYGIGQGFFNASEESVSSLRVLMKGYNFNELENQAILLANKLLKHKRVQSVRIDDRLRIDEKDSEEYIIALNQSYLKTYGLTPYQVTSHLQFISKQVNPFSVIRLGNTQVNLLMNEKNARKLSIYDVMESPMMINGKTIKLKNTASISLQEVASTIYKFDRQYTRVIGCDYQGTTHFANNFLTETLNEIRKELPIGYSADTLGWNWNLDQTKRQYALIALLIIANFVICSILFESVRLPLFIIIMTPVSFIGLFVIFSVFDIYFDQGGYAAFVLLSGLVVNAAIFFVHDLKENLIKGSNPNRVLLKTLANRSNAILLTVISTCCGVIPFIINGQKEVFWFAFSIGTIGGLLMSLVSIFIVLPVYMWRK